MSGMLFYCYVLENFVKYVNASEIEANNADFDYVELDDNTREKINIVKLIAEIKEIMTEKGVFAKINRITAVFEV